jgi:hypothetical protein
LKWSRMLEIILSSPNQAHTAIKSAWEYAKPQLFGGRKLVMRIVDHEEAKTAQQRKYIHGYIYLEISKQAVVGGQKFNLATWKEHFRSVFLGDEVVEVLNPMTGVITKQAVRVSTESLGVRGYNKLIEQVTAFATTELGVRFDESFESWVEENMR